MNVLSKRGLLGAAALVIVAAAAVTGGVAIAGSKDGTASAKGLGPISGLLPRDHLTEESAIQVDLSKESVRLPLYQGVAYKGTPNEEKVWYVLLDASDQGIAHDLGVNYAPKLGNLAISDPEAVQTVTLESPTPDQNKFGQAVVDFQGAPDFSPTRIAEPGPTGFPLAKFQPGAVAGPGYTPFIRLAGSPTVYSAPIVATGDGPFDVTHHTNTGDRVLGVHIADPAPQGQYAESWVDLLFVKGFDAGQPIVYISTDAGQPLTSVLERSTYVPALDNAPVSRRRRLPRLRPRAPVRLHQRPDRRRQQGIARLRPPDRRRPCLRGRKRRKHRADRRPSQRWRPAERVRRLPDQTDPRHADAYSPLWDAQLGLWTDKAVKQGLNTSARSTRCRSSTSPQRARTCSPASTRRPASPLPTARSASTSTAP